MNLPRIIQVLTEEPLLITPSAHASLFQLFQDHAKMTEQEFRAKREGVDFCGQEVELEQAEVVDGILHIPIAGPIGSKLGKFEKGAGAVDTTDITDEINQGEANSSVRAILFDIDSPGGMVTGTPELADRIVRCDKPIYAFTSGMMCSAAFWLGAACDGIFATRSADIGSIGVFVPFFDQSERYKAAGVKVEVISSGLYKGLGVPGTSLTEPQREFMQNRVLEIAEMFYSHCLTCKPDMKSEDMQGQVFKAEAAMSKGMIDEVVADKEAAIAFLS